MRNRPILLAIGIAVTVGLFEGSRAEAPVICIPGDAPRVAACGGDAFARIRRAGMVREVTAYNVGVREQTSDEPCIGASGENLCRLVEEGRSVCAANFVALGTVLRIADYGECVVLDRMNRRFPHRVDIAMSEDAIDEAVEFGLKRRIVEVKE